MDTPADSRRSRLQRPSGSGSRVLRTERDVIESLQGRCVTLADIYAACRDAGVETRDGGDEIVHGRSDTRWRRRARGALQTLRRGGQASRVGEGTWLIRGTIDHPAHLVWVIAGDPSRMELVLASAEKLLKECPDAPALIVADPPWGLGIQATGRADRDAAERLYARNADRVVGGYRDVDPSQYAEFSQRWIHAAAALLPLSSYLAIITGPGQAARVQVTAEEAGLTFINQIIIPRPFALATSRRFSHAHTVVTVVCRGTGTRCPGRFFSVPDDLPKARSGRDYPLDVWSDVGKHERRNLVRYPTMLHPVIPSRLIRALTSGDDNGGTAWESLVVDPFVGGGETAIAAWSSRRRFYGGDVNPRALRLTAARLLAHAASSVTGNVSALA